MRDLLRQLAEDGDRGTVLVIGAGDGSGLPQFRQLRGARLVLVEAHPGYAEMLARQVDASRGEQVLAVAACGDAGLQEAPLHVLNNPQFSSLRMPAMQEHFPNLGITHDARVATRPLDEIIRPLGLDPRGNHLLIVDAPGIAGDLLDGVQPMHLQQFEKIIVSAPLEPLYAGETVLPILCERLSALGFDAGDQDQQETLPRAARLFARNPLRVMQQQHASQLAGERREFEQSLAHLGQERDQLASDLKAAAATISEQELLIERLVVRRDELAKALAESKSSHQAASDEAIRQQTLIQQLLVRRDELTALVESQAAQLRTTEQLEDAQGQHEREMTELRGTIARLTDENKQHAQRAARLESEYAEAGKRQRQLEQETLRAEAQVDLIKDILLRESPV
jgi:FkbM family methyltransferase